MSVTALRRAAAAPPTLTTSTRAVLAEKIEEHKAIAAEVATINRLLDEGQFSFDALFAAQALADRAREQATLAEQMAGEALLRAAMGMANSETKDLKTARAELQGAEDRVAEIRSARKSLEAKIAPTRSRLDFAAREVEEAANAVVRAHIGPDIDRLITKINAAYIAAGELSNLFSWLLVRAVDDRGPDAHPRALETSCRFTSLPCTWAENDITRSALRGKWVAAHAALLTDASAPLPAVVE